MADIEPILIKILILLATLGGLIVASYIRNKKQKNEVLVCPIDTDCNAVVNSKYSKFFGIPVELLGQVYYAVFLIIYAIVLFTTPLGDVLEGILIGLSSLAALFSLYLVSLQAFVIKEWCLWCMMSFASSAIIFILFVLL